MVVALLFIATFIFIVLEETRQTYDFVSNLKPKAFINYLLTY